MLKLFISGNNIIEGKLSEVSVIGYFVLKLTL